MGPVLGEGLLLLARCAWGAAGPWMAPMWEGALPSPVPTRLSGPDILPRWEMVGNLPNRKERPLRSQNLQG